MTLTPGPTPRALAEAFGLGHHPYGVPSWIGLRVGPDGLVHAKAYHAFSPQLRGPAADGSWPLPAGLPAGLTPVMAARDGEATELYLRLGPACAWADFVTACTAALLGTRSPRPPFRFAPEPQPARGAFCVSLRWQGGRFAALTLYADQRALPDDAAVRQQWSQDMSEGERQAYELALCGVRATGPRRGPWHAMLAWSVDADGAWHRAASLRVPELPAALPC